MTASATTAPIIRSDTLPQLRRVLESLPALRAYLGDILQVVLVLDASCVQGELRWRVGPRINPAARTYLHEAIVSGVVIAFALAQAHRRIHTKALAKCPCWCDIDSFFSGSTVSCRGRLSSCHVKKSGAERPSVEKRKSCDCLRLPSLPAVARSSLPYGNCRPGASERICLQVLQLRCLCPPNSP
jgi:hypothetical protein